MGFIQDFCRRSIAMLRKVAGRAMLAPSMSFVTTKRVSNSAHSTTEDLTYIAPNRDMNVGISRPHQSIDSMNKIVSTKPEDDRYLGNACAYSRHWGKYCNESCPRKRQSGWYSSHYHSNSSSEGSTKKERRQDVASVQPSTQDTARTMRRGSGHFGCEFARVLRNERTRIRRLWL